MTACQALIRPPSPGRTLLPVPAGRRFGRHSRGSGRHRRLLHCLLHCRPSSTASSTAIPAARPRGGRSSRLGRSGRRVDDGLRLPRCPTRASNHKHPRGSMGRMSSGSGAPRRRPGRPRAMHRQMTQLLLVDNGSRQRQDCGRRQVGADAYCCSARPGPESHSDQRDAEDGSPQRNCANRQPPATR